MRTIRYPIGPGDGGKTVERFLRGDQGFSGRMVITLKKLPRGLLLNGAHVRTIDPLAPVVSLSRRFKARKGVTAPARAQWAA